MLQGRVTVTGWLCVLAVLLFVSSRPAVALDTEAAHAILIDTTTKTILLDKKADERMYPASITKLMTAYVLFEKLKNNELRLDQKFLVSEKAWRMEGSRTFLPLGEMVQVDDLLKGMIIQSGNDASVALAEGVAGSEESFAGLMNAKAKELGMTGSNFLNVTGLPDPEHYSTARDLAILGLAIIERFPEYYSIYSTRDFTYNKIKQPNRNPLLATVEGADGMKTGYTEAAGYSMVGSAVREGRRLLMVIGGLPTAGKRALEARKLIERGFNEFSTPVYYRKNDTVLNVPVWLGVNQEVPLMAAQDVLLTIPRSEQKDIVLKATFNGPLFAPLAKGAPAGTLEISSPRFQTPLRFPLVVGVPVGKVGFMERLKRKIGFIVTGDLAEAS